MTLLQLKKVRFKFIFEKVQVSNCLSNVMRQCVPVCYDNNNNNNINNAASCERPRS